MSWTAVNNAQSYAILVNHTNSTGNFTHWAVKNIPANVLNFPQNSNGGGVTLENSFKINGYSGPESLSVSQTYNFYIFALKKSSMVANDLQSFYTELENEMIGYGKISSVYANTKT